MQKLLTTFLTFIIFTSIGSAQEFTDMRSGDLLKSLKTRFVRECGQSPFLSNYQEANARFAPKTKTVHTQRGEFYQKDILIEKGYIITRSESTPFEKTIETFNIDYLGRLSRASKRTTRMHGEEILQEETDITSISYGDTLCELHNYNAMPSNSRCDFSYSYIYDSTGLVVQKIANTHINHIDTTCYEYDAQRRIVKELLGNKTVIQYEYNSADNITRILRLEHDQETPYVTTFTYDDKNRLSSISLQESYTQTDLKLRYNSSNQLIWFSCQTSDGDETINEECNFEYNAMGHISKDCSGFTYQYKYDKKGNWTKCDILRNGKKTERISRKITYKK